MVHLLPRGCAANPTLTVVAASVKEASSPASAGTSGRSNGILENRGAIRSETRASFVPMNLLPELVRFAVGNERILFENEIVVDDAHR